LSQPFDRVKSREDDWANDIASALGSLRQYPTTDFTKKKYYERQRIESLQTALFWNIRIVQLWSSKWIDIGLGFYS